MTGTTGKMTLVLNDRPSIKGFSFLSQPKLHVELTFNVYLKLRDIDPFKVEKDMWVSINEILRKCLESVNS